MGNCLSLHARGWGIDHQVRTKLQIPGGMPGGEIVKGRIKPFIRFTDSLYLNLYFVPVREKSIVFNLSEVIITR